MSCNESEKAMKRDQALSKNAIVMFIMVLHNGLFVSPARNGEQWAGCAMRSSARLSKSAAVFRAIVPHNRRIIKLR